jgi:gas vesicle protein
MMSTHLYFHKHVLNDINIYFSKEKRKNLNILNLPICLNKMKQKIKSFEDSIKQKKSDQIMVQEVYLH